MVEILHTIDTFGSSTCDALKAVCLDIIDLDMLRERIGLNEEPPFVLSDSLLLEIEKRYSRELEVDLMECRKELERVRLDTIVYLLSTEDILVPLISFFFFVLK